MRLSTGDSEVKKRKSISRSYSTTVNQIGQPQISPALGSAGSSSALSIAPAATGDGGVVQPVVVDTASDVAWVQCHPQASSYDPTRSSTYAAFACNSPACAQLGPYAGGCVNNQCQYNVTYADGSSTSGTYSSDVLTINPANAATAISNFQFGCSRAERGSFGGRSVGIMALGGGTESLASQTAATHGNVFSYCIPTPSSRGFFVLGAPSRAASRYVVTPMLRDPRAPTFYRVLLRAITVGGQRLNIAPAVFAAGTVLDSRTAITRLPPTAYRALRAAFRSAMSLCISYLFRNTEMKSQHLRHQKGPELCACVLEFILLSLVLCCSALALFSGRCRGDFRELGAGVLLGCSNSRANGRGGRCGGRQEPRVLGPGPRQGRHRRARIGGGLGGTTGGERRAEGTGSGVGARRRGAEARRGSAPGGERRKDKGLNLTMT